MKRSFLPAKWLLVLRTLVMLGVIATLQPAWSASSDRIEIIDAALVPGEDGWNIEAQFEMSLTPDLGVALERGLSLFFVVEFDLTRSRWYWFDERPAAATMTYRLSYHALTRQYRLSTGNLQLGFSSLAEAIGVMSRVRDWHVVDRAAVRPGDTYVGALRMRLDKSQLPKPFQLDAITSREWSLESDWRRMTLEVPK
jgi:hypothetical protein